MRWIQGFINPGTLYLPRPDGRGKYIILELISDGKQISKINKKNNHLSHQHQKDHDIMTLEI
jgi:hypothetical protein